VTDRTRIVIATRNPGKLAEVSELLEGLDFEILSLRSFPDAPEVEEAFRTYVENATAKARAVSEYTGLIALAEDSGLEVDALGGQPGVRSARFAGEPADDAKNIDKLVGLLEGIPNSERTARFRCVMVATRPRSESTLVVDGVVEGVIATSPRGSAGFGYDPVFMIPSLGRTFAELSPAEKHRLSHRGQACRRLRERLPAFLREKKVS